MTSPADLGGMPGFGPVESEPDEPPFHHEWERRAFAIYLATNYLGRWNIDQVRATRERMPRAEYLATSYYGVWLYGIERLLDDRGIVTRDQVAARRADPTATVARVEDARVLAAADVERVMSNPRASRLDHAVLARFAVGDSVTTKTSEPSGHTRLPRYARGRCGLVTADHGVWIFADAAGQDRGFIPQHVYTVRFSARELWGDRADRRDSVYVDLWDDHLEPA